MYLTTAYLPSQTEIASGKLSAPVSDDVQRALWKLLRPIVNPIAYGIQRPGDEPRQTTKDSINAFYLASFNKQLGAKYDWAALRLQRLKFEHISNAFAGDYALHFYSQWTGGRMLVRIDIDNPGHGDEGHAESKRCADWLNTEYLGGRAYSVASAHGHSLYLFIRVAGCMAYMNTITQRLGASLDYLRAARGFTCTVEVFGKFLEREELRYEESGYPLPRLLKKSTKLIGMVRMPMVRTLDDVDRLAAAAFLPGDLVRLTEDAEAAMNASAARKADQDRRLAELTAAEDDDPGQGRASRNSKRHSDHVADARCKAANSRNVLNRACKKLGLRSKSARQRHRAEILELAHDLYDSNGLSANSRDVRREKRFANTLEWMIRTHDENKASKGNDPHWFNADDLARVETRIRSTIPGDALDDLSANLPDRLTYGLLSIAACTINKNVQTEADGYENSLGQVPVSAIRGMFRHFGLPYHGSIIKACFDLLVQYEIITCTDSYYEKNRCRTWSILRPHWFAPNAHEAARRACIDEVPAASSRMVPAALGPSSFKQYLDSLPVSAFEAVALPAVIEAEIPAHSLAFADFVRFLEITA